MDYIKLGNTGMDVSRICLGCMSFGEVTPGFHKWVLNEADSREIINRAHGLGVNFFDTANSYSQGTSEEFLGRALKEFNRDEIVVATKVFFPLREGANSQGLSRKNILAEIDNSLKRLGMDYVDLYIIHRWDYDTPAEETMTALNDVVKSGKARYIGASAMYAWQFQKAQFTAEKNSLMKFVSMQNHYNLLYREDEREMMPLCRDMNVAVTPYSPLAAGRLARNWTAETPRFETDTVAKRKYDDTQNSDKIILDRVSELSKKYGVPMARIALAWLLGKKPVAAPVIGATKLSHIEDAVAALDVKLSDGDISYLEEPYALHKISGAR